MDIDKLEKKFIRLPKETLLYNYNGVKCFLRRPYFKRDYGWNFGYIVYGGDRDNRKHILHIQNMDKFELRDHIEKVYGVRASKIVELMYLINLLDDMSSLHKGEGYGFSTIEEVNKIFKKERKYAGLVGNYIPRLITLLYNEFRVHRKEKRLEKNKHKQ